jgi:hypothetical protein
MTQYAEDLIRYVSDFGRRDRSAAIAFLDMHCDPEWQTTEEQPPSDIIFLDELNDDE